LPVINIIEPLNLLFADVTVMRKLVNRLSALSIIILVVLALAGCGTNTPSLPRQQTAREELEQRGLAYEAATFVDLAKGGDTAAVKLFLSAGMNPEAKDAGGWTSLIQASREGRAETIETLLTAKADVNARNYQGSFASIELVSVAKITAKRGKASVCTFANGDLKHNARGLKYFLLIFLT